MPFLLPLLLLFLFLVYKTVQAVSHSLQNLPEEYLSDKNIEEEEKVSFFKFKNCLIPIGKIKFARMTNNYQPNGTGYMN